MRDAHLDAVVVGDRRYSRWLSGFAIPRHEGAFELYTPGSGLAGAGAYTDVGVVIVPLTGEVTLVTPPGYLRGAATAARIRSWVPRILSTYRDDPRWEMRTNWGRVADGTAEDVTKALRDSGLTEARIGIVGGWPEMELTQTELSRARFSPALTVDSNGVERNLLDVLTETVSPWEIRVLGRTQAAADRGLTACMREAVAGARYRDVLRSGKYECERGCTEALLQISVCSSEAPWIADMVVGDGSLYPPESRFSDGDLVHIEFINQTDGYWLQTSRSWVIGRPNRTQMHVLATTKHASEEALKRLEPGVTGEQMWNLSVDIFVKAGLQMWGRTGHAMGLRHRMDRRFDFLPGNHTPIPSDIVIVTHPLCIDAATMTSAHIGDSVLMTDGGCRPLSASPVSYEFTFGS
jgi:Xaa-Pro aminopeptidase